MIKDYYSLAKPGIIYGNAITVVAGFMLAVKGHIDWLLLITTLVGVSLVVASGCVFNNFIDRDIDASMERTKNRALVKGAVSLRGALVYGTILGFTGIAILAFCTNVLTVATALAGLFVYVVVYSLWFKRRSIHGTIIGSISGAVPPVVGYLAVSNNIDTGAIILFFILALWQMPHSFAIAIYRIDDYIKAGIPVLPAKKGILVTKIQMLIYVALFVIATFALAVFGYAGYAYFFTMALFGTLWFGLSVRGFWATDDKLWARNMFIYSIGVIAAFATAVSF
ncbi:MAG: protoheme IX farnesyltransferase [Candidatus Yonathbacteria bacterium]|nr:protoheme IX farnesyltransferase [Candidatus Yonathbacteria bacterium]